VRLSTGSRFGFDPWLLTYKRGKVRQQSTFQRRQRIAGAVYFDPWAHRALA